MICERCREAESTEWSKEADAALCGSCARGSRRVRTKESGGTLILLVERGSTQERYLRDLLSSGEAMPFEDSSGGRVLVRVTSVRSIDRRLGFTLVPC
jgi:hypothetical protein